MEDEHKVIDLSKLYFGIQDADYLIGGRCYSSKSYELYFLMGLLKSGNVGRYFFKNMETGEEIVVNEKGNVIKFKSKEATINSVTGIKSLKETVDLLVKNTDKTIFDGEERENIKFYKSIQKYMNTQIKKNRPTYSNLDVLNNIIDITPEMYILSYGDVIHGKSLLLTLNQFIQAEKVGGNYDNY